MNIAGVVVEYNPFHNGHLYHLQETRKQTGADLVIAVISGPFLQRGEPALLSKWARAKLALQAGVDLVIELPYAYATQKAEIFAWGAVASLDALGTTHVCFGSEDGSTEPFINTLEALTKRTSDFDFHLKHFLGEGNSYPKAASLAFSKLGLAPEHHIDLSMPNNILGYHYVEAVHKLQSNIKVHTVLRKQAGYHDREINDTQIASATAIRRVLFGESEDIESLEKLTPPYTAQALIKARENGLLRRWEDYFPFLQYRLLTDSPEQLSDIYEAEEGLENRLIKFARESNTFEAFMKAIKTKGYTWTRLQRLCTHILTGATKDKMTPAAVREKPSYIRLLGMNEKGKNYLNNKKKTLDIPLISSVGRSENNLLALDLRAQDCYQIVKPNDEPDEYSQKPILFY